MDEALIDATSEIATRATHLKKRNKAHLMMTRPSLNNLVSVILLSKSLRISAT